MIKSSRLWILSLLLMTVVCLQAQDFDLYFANNVSDVANLRSIRNTNQLNWQRVTNGVLATNKVQVEQVKSMFASTAMKGREQQQLFWKMRDNTLLCFRINDGKNSGATYEVRMYYNDNKDFLYLGVSNYFFVNIPHKDDKVTIKVNKNVNRNIDKPDTLTFTYQVFDWDDERLYTFQLDSKRQAENRSYQLEYTTTNDGGQATTKILELKNDKFQSFYVPEGESLTAVNLISNNNGNEQKLKMDLNKLLYGVWLSDVFKSPRLEANFNLDKHANRELTIFNMLGTGLVEHFDTLFLTIHGRKNRFVENATLNVVSLNHKGEYVADSHVKVDQYDSQKHAYRIITMGNPAYVEILAPGYYPRLYRYLGASDPTTGVLDTKRCHANVTLLSGRYDSQKEAIGEQTIYLLKDLQKSTTIGDKKYQLFGIDSIKTETRGKEDEIVYVEDGGYQKPKMLDGKQIDKYARMRITMSAPKGKSQQPPQLKANEKDGTTSYTFNYLDRSAVLASNYPGLTRDYYDLYYNLLDPQLPEDKAFKLLLTLDGRSFGQFPYLRRKVIIYKEIEEKSKDQGKKMVSMDGLDLNHGGANILPNWVFSPNFNFSITSMPGLSMSFIPIFHWDRMYVDCKLSMSLGTGRGGDDSNGDEDRKTLKSNSVKEGFVPYSASDPNRLDDKGNPIETQKLTINPTSKTMALEKVDQEKWFMNEFDDLFKVQGNKLGTGWYFDGLFGFSIPFKPKEAGFYINTVNVTVGYGAFSCNVANTEEVFSGINKAAAEKLSRFLKFKIIGNAALYGQGSLGVKRYGFTWDKNNVLRTGKMGWLFDVDLCGKAGISASLAINATGDNDSTAARYFTRFFTASINARAGAKLQLGFATGGQIYQDITGGDWGFKILAMIGGELFADIKTPVLHWRPRISGCLGNRWLLPSDTGNPFVPGYPWWLGSSSKKAPHRAENDVDKEDLVTDNPYVDIGDCMVNGLGGRAVPTFLHDGAVALLNEQNTNRNGDRVEVKATDGTTSTVISTTNRQASAVSTASAGEYEAIGYSELVQEIDESALNTYEQRVAKSDELQQQARIVVKRRQGDSGTWQETLVPKVAGEDAAEGFIDMEPRITIQADGKMACLWKHGKYEDAELDAAEIAGMTDEERLALRYFKGHYAFSVYDGQQWSAPQQLLTPISLSFIPVDYQLVMHKDSLLMATNIATYEEKEGKTISTNTLWYHSWVNGQVVSTIDVTEPLQFSMCMVGDRVVCASLFETPDTIRDIRVHAMNMRGLLYDDYSVDLDLSKYMPQTLKVVADKTIDEPTDFAILWTRNDNQIRVGNKNVGQPTMQTILNASRIYMNDNMFAAPYITIGATRDQLTMTGYDALLDDSEIRTVYTLMDPETFQSHVMLSTQEFFNDFEYELSCNNAALVGGSVLPVSLTIYNTGTSPITSVRGMINDKDITTMMDSEDVSNLYIAPNDKETISLRYPVTADFNGLLLPKDIEAGFENVFSRQYSFRRAASMLRVVKPNENNECTMAYGFENISCKLVTHSVEGTVNTFDIEVTDHSSQGLQADHVVYVGIYPGPCYNVPFSDTAQEILTASDFQEVAGERKAYVTLTIQNVDEAEWGCVNAFVYDQRLLDIHEEAEDESFRVVGNLSADECLIGVNLVPSEEDELTGLPIVRNDETSPRHITVTREEGGFRLSGLTSDDGRVRVFDAKATPVYSAFATKGTMLIPITQHGVYLISTNNEVFKYNY